LYKWNGSRNSLNLRRGVELRNERERNQPGKKIDKIDSGIEAVVIKHKMSNVNRKARS